MVKLRQIMQNPEIVATKGLGFLFFSIYFRFFVFFFRLFFAFLCSILVGSRLPITNLTKSKNCKKKLFFFVFVSVFSRCFSMFFELFSNRKNIDIFNLFADYMFESQKTIFNLYFRIIFEIKKKM